jgi:predicted unusual protein kinase regulating ubiquinone biosynthesis (AarF/ABC1/UbiB family)
MGRRDDLKSLSTGWARRTLSAGRMAASMGKAAVKGAVARVTDDDAVALGEALGDRMDEMKGLAMKVGQMVSYLDGAVPDGTARVLRRLQASGRPLEPERVVALIEGALGAPIETLFDRFEREPLAAASIGQVHRAVLDGEDVAVKVQYPEIAKTLEVDLGNASRIGLLASLGTSVSSSTVLGELRERFAEECDYLREAANTELFRAAFADEAAVRIPRTVPARTAGTVITTELVDGRSLYAFAAASTEAERDRAGEIVFSFAFRSIFRHAAFNADPHPGNYLFPPDGRVAFLDFGCVRYFDAAFVARWKALARCLLEGRRADFPDVVRPTGIVGSAKFDFDAHWELMRYLYRPFLTPGFRYDAAYVSESFDLLKWKNPNLRHTAMPAEWLFANRLQWGMNSVLGILGARGDWGGIFRRWVEEPTVPLVRPTSA